MDQEIPASPSKAMVLQTQQALAERSVSLLSRMDCYRPTRSMTDETLALHAAAVAGALAPAGRKTTMALLAGKLFAVLPMPAIPEKGPSPLPIWVDRLEIYPPDVLARAIYVVIDRHKWPRPPTIADVVEACRADAAYKARQTAACNARILSTKALERLPVERTPDEQADEDRKKRAILAAYFAHRRAPHAMLVAACDAALRRAAGPRDDGAEAAAEGAGP